MNRILFRTRIKFCGFTRPGDVRLACELGADAIGFVFARNSPRRIEPEEARAMRQALAPLVDAVALFMDNPVDEVREVVRQIRPSLLQFHGDEDDAFCRGFGVPYLKAIPMGGGSRASTTRLRTVARTAIRWLNISPTSMMRYGRGQTLTTVGAGFSA